MSFLDGKKLFIAGASGLVGSALIKLLLERYPKTKIRASVFKTKPFIKHPGIEYFSGDLRSEKFCRKLAGDCDCGILAAGNSPGSHVLASQSWEQMEDNVAMNALLLKACALKKVKRVVYVGSATLYQECYGRVSESDLDLNKDPQGAHFGIGWAFRYIEKLCRSWHEQFGKDIVVLRASNVFGPYAKFNPRLSNFIPAIVRKAVEGMDPFEVWGSPGVTRDVLFSEDFAKAVLAAMNRTEVKFDIFNIGSGTKTTVGDVVGWALKYAGHKPRRIRYDSKKPATIKFRVLGCSKAQRVLGWAPRNTTEDGIKKTVEWWIENKRWWKK